MTNLERKEHTGSRAAPDRKRLSRLCQKNNLQTKSRLPAPRPTPPSVDPKHAVLAEWFRERLHEIWCHLLVKTTGVFEPHSTAPSLAVETRLSTHLSIVTLSTYRSAEASRREPRIGATDRGRLVSPCRPRPARPGSAPSHGVTGTRAGRSARELGFRTSPRLYPPAPTVRGEVKRFRTVPTGTGISGVCPQWSCSQSTIVTFGTVHVAAPAEFGHQGFWRLPDYKQKSGNDENSEEPKESRIGGT